jgi:hypothetical protein
MSHVKRNQCALARTDDPIWSIGLLRKDQLQSIQRHLFYRRGNMLTLRAVRFNQDDRLIRWHQMHEPAEQQTAFIHIAMKEKEQRTLVALSIEHSAGIFSESDLSGNLWREKADGFTSKQE